jgi:hypothetical protein
MIVGNDSTAEHAEIAEQAIAGIFSAASASSAVNDL